MKKIIIIIMVFTMLFLSAVPTFSECCGCGEKDYVKVFVNEKELGFPDQRPFINKDNRTLVPVRFVSQALGAKVNWQEEIQSVDIAHKGKNIKLHIGERQAQVGEKTVHLDTNASIINNRTMVPLRFVSECLGAIVEWNGEGKAVYITTDLPPVKTIYQGSMYQENGLPNYSKSAPIFFNEYGRNMNITVNDLPLKTPHYIFYSITPDDKYLTVKMYSEDKSSAPLYLAEHGVINRQRNEIKGHSTNVFTFKYEIPDPTDDTYGFNMIETKDISHFVFLDYDEELNHLYITIANPLYENKK